MFIEVYQLSCPKESDDSPNFLKEGAEIFSHVRNNSVYHVPVQQEPLFILRLQVLLVVLLLVLVGLDQTKQFLFY